MNYERESRKLIELASRHSIVLLEGPRGCDKSRIARLTFSKKAYIDLEDNRIFRLLKSSPRTFLMAFPNGAVINEVGLLPPMIDAVKYHVDKTGAEPGRYILTSSCHIKTEGLDERLAHMRLDGLTYPQIVNMKLPVSNPFQLIRKGQLREVLCGEDSQMDILLATIEKDLSRHINGMNMHYVRDFLSCCARQSGGRLSMNRIAKETGISGPTAKAWLGLLQSYNLVRLVEDKKSSAPQIFMADTGLLCALLGIATKEDLILSPFRDMVANTLIADEILKTRASRDMEPGIKGNGPGCFMANWKRNYTIIVESNIDVTKEKMDLAHSFCSDMTRKTVILYLGDVTYSVGQIDCISYRDWASFASDLDYFS